MDSIVVVGLGNPGTEYEWTRHNVGFKVVDEVARRFKAPIRAGRGEYLSCSFVIGDKRVILAKPLTYMNNSGSAVGELLKANNAGLDDLIVVIDDFALPLGSIRVRQKGSDGGHNGLSSIIYELKTNEFARIRCGIRQEKMPPKERMADFVLSVFEREEQEVAGAMTARAADAVLAFATGGIAGTMNKFNTELKPA